MTKNTTSPTLYNAEDLASCTCANLRKATRLVTQAYDAALQPTGLKSTQFTVLATLAGQRERSLPITRLAAVLVMDRTTLTRNLKPLIRRSLVEIVQEGDLRVRNVGLTDAGKAMFEDARPRWDQAQAMMVETLGPARWSGLLNDLEATITAMQNS